MAEFEGRLPVEVVSEVVRQAARDLRDCPPAAQREMVERSARQRLLDRATGPADEDAGE